MEEYLLLGYITDAFSLDGTLKVLSKTNFAEKRYEKGNKIVLYNERNKQNQEFTVEHFRKSGLFDFVKLEGINTKEEALAYKGYEIKVLKDRNDLENGYYFYSDLVGCKVIDQNNNEAGKVIQVEEFPAQITLRVSYQDKTYFVPFIKAFINEVNIGEKTIKINLIDGML